MAKASKDIIQKHEQMFYPTVRVRTNKAGGSGTVIYSKKHASRINASSINAIRITISITILGGKYTI